MTSHTISALDSSFAMNVSVSSSECADIDDNDNEGDSRFMALELLSQGGRAPAADVFSLGMSAFELTWDIAAPAEGEPWRDVREGRLPPLPPHCNPSNRSLALLNLVAAMLRPDPTTRPSAAEICALPQVQFVLANGPDPLLAFHSKEIEEARNGGGIISQHHSQASFQAQSQIYNQNHSHSDSLLLPSLLAVPKSNTSVPAAISAAAVAAAVGNEKPIIMMGRSSSYRVEQEQDNISFPSVPSLGGLAPVLVSRHSLENESPFSAPLISTSEPELIRGRTLFLNNDDDDDDYNNNNDDNNNDDNIKDEEEEEKKIDDFDINENVEREDVSIFTSGENGGLDVDNAFLQSSQPSDSNEGVSSSSSSGETELLSSNRLKLRRAIDFVNESTDIFTDSSSSLETMTTSIDKADKAITSNLASGPSVHIDQSLSSSLMFPAVPPSLSQLQISQTRQPTQSHMQSQQIQPQQLQPSVQVSSQASALFKPYSSVSARKHPRDYDKHQPSTSSLFAPAPFGGAFSFASPKATVSSLTTTGAPSSIGALDMRSLQAQMPSATPTRGARARTQRRRAGGVAGAGGGSFLGSTLLRIDSPTPLQQNLNNDSVTEDSESGLALSQGLSAISSSSSSQSSSQTGFGSHIMSAISSSEDGSSGGIGLRAFHVQQGTGDNSRVNSTSPNFGTGTGGGLNSHPRMEDSSEFRLDESAVSYNQHDESIISNSAVDTAFFSTRKSNPQQQQQQQVSQPHQSKIFFTAPHPSLSINVTSGGVGGGKVWNASSAPSPSEGGVTPTAKRERVGSSPVAIHLAMQAQASTSSLSLAHDGILGNGNVYNNLGYQQQQQQHQQQQQPSQQQRPQQLMRPTPVSAATSLHYLHRPLPTPLTASASASASGTGNESMSHHMQLATHKVWAKVASQGSDAPMSIVAPSAYHSNNFSDHRMETSTVHPRVGLHRGEAPAALPLKWDTDDDFEEPEGLLRRAQTSPIQMNTQNSTSPSATSPSATSPKQFSNPQQGGLASRLHQTARSIAAPVKSRLSASSPSAAGSSRHSFFAGGGGAPTPVRDFLPPTSSYRGSFGDGGGRGSAQQRDSRGGGGEFEQAGSSPTSPKGVDAATAAANNRRIFFGQGSQTDTSSLIPTLLPIPTRQPLPLRIQVNMNRTGSSVNFSDGQTTPLNNDGFITPYGQGIVLDAKHWQANM